MLKPKANGSGDLDAININTKGSPVINIIIELSKCLQSSANFGWIEGTIFDSSWLLLVVIFIL